MSTQYSASSRNVHKKVFGSADIELDSSCKLLGGEEGLELTMLLFVDVSPRNPIHICFFI
jgi:hypothetical protein